MTLSVSVRHSFSTFELDATFDAPDGITVLFGRSGSGKTTVINSVAGLRRSLAFGTRPRASLLPDGRTRRDYARGPPRPETRQDPMKVIETIPFGRS